jgi:uracil-DNA glycosylase
MTPPTELSPAEELAQLAGALAAEVRRQRRFGRSECELAPGTVQGEVARPMRPAAIPAARAQPLLSPAPARNSPALEAAAVQAKHMRRVAEGCADLASLAAAVAACRSCGLCSTRTQTVFADGQGRIPLMFVGEAPGENEDLQGVPFVGRAGALLTDIITKGMGLRREDVTIVNVLKCRPPENRDPSEIEKVLCTAWLDRQIELVNPRVLVPLGRHAAQHILRTEAPMSALRGRVHDLDGRKVVPTYHPAYLLRSPDKKKDCWQDIQLAMRELGLEPPGRARAS